MKVVKFFLVVIICLGLIIFIFFIFVVGLDWVKEYGKLLFFVIGIVNVIVGGVILGGVFSKMFKNGFELWLKLIIVKGEFNLIYGFGVIVLIWNLIVILFFV